MPNLITQRYSDEELEQMRASLRDSLEKTDKGGTANSIRNCVIVFENDPLFAGKIMRNLLTETDDMIGEFPWRRDTTRFDDQDLPHVLLHFEQYYGIRSEKCVQNAFRVVASAHGFHPIRNYLRKLRWDGNYRIRYALHHFLGAEVNDYNEACLQLFMLGAVKRIFEPGAKFDLMLVLTGGQGAGKSTFLRFLAVRDEWFSDDLKKLDDEKVYQRLAGHWIMEMSEMVATANAKSIARTSSPFSPGARIPTSFPMTATLPIICGNAYLPGPPTKWISCPWTEAATAASFPFRCILSRRKHISWRMKKRPAPILT